MSWKVFFLIWHKCCNVGKLPKWQICLKFAKKALKLLFWSMKVYFVYCCNSNRFWQSVQKKFLFGNLPNYCICPEKYFSWFGTSAGMLEMCQNGIKIAKKALKLLLWPIKVYFMYSNTVIYNFCQFWQVAKISFMS